MRFSFVRFVAIVWFFSVPLLSQAALVDNGTYFTDSSTQTDYLKLSQVSLSSYDAILVQDLPGFLAAGWSITSQAGFNALSQSDRALIYNTSNQSGNIYLHTNQDLTGNPSVDGTFAYYDRLNSFGHSLLSNSQINRSLGDSAYFISLSRVTVPVPAAGWLFFSGLACLLGRKRSFQS